MIAFSKPDSLKTQQDIIKVSQQDGLTDLILQNMSGKFSQDLKRRSEKLKSICSNKQK